MLKKACRFRRDKVRHEPFLYLFEVTKPEGETKNLLAKHPEIAARLGVNLTT